jgi:hypothetical protein
MSDDNFNEIPTLELNSDTNDKPQDEIKKKEQQEVMKQNALKLLQKKRKESNDEQLDKPNKKIATEPETPQLVNIDIQKDTHTQEVASEISKEDKPSNNIIDNNEDNTPRSMSTSAKPAIESSNIDSSVPKPVENPTMAKKISFKEAKKEIDEFSQQMDNVLDEIKTKYGIDIVSSSYDEYLPDELKIKLIEDFFNDKDVQKIAKENI